MMMVSPKNNEPENRSPIRRVAPQRSWKSSDSLVGVAPVSSLSRPVSPSRRGSNGSDYNDDENSFEENKRGSNLIRSKSSSATSPRRVSRGMPSSRLHLPSQERSSFPDRPNGLSRWKSTSECLRASSIPEDSCLLSLTKKHPADTDPSTDNSPRMPGQPRATRSSFSTDNEINMIVEDDEFAAPPPPPPRPITMMRRYQSELVPQRGMLMEMQQSLASSAAPPETSSSKRRGDDDRPAPPRRAPSRSPSECAKRAPLQRSLSRNTSMRRAPVSRPEEEEEPQQQPHASSPTSRDNESSGRRPAPPRRAPSRTISESVSAASTPPLQRSPSRLSSMVRRSEGDAARREDDEEEEEPRGSESICAGRPAPPRRLPSRSVSERVAPPLQRTLSRHNSIKRPHPAAAPSRD